MEDTAITKEDIEQKRGLAHDIIQQLKKLVYQTGMTFIEIGRLLKIVRDEKLYKYSGEGGYDSFASFIADADLAIAPATAYAFIYLYEKFVLNFGFAEDTIANVPYYKLQMLASKVKLETKEDAEEWLAKAQTLSISDFKAELAEAKANKEGGEFLPYPTIYKCKSCKKWRYECEEKYQCKCV